MREQIGMIAAACVFVSIGIAAGWYSARQGADLAVEPADEQDAAAGLSPQTLKNLGVTVGPAKLSRFVRYAKVQATVVDAPLNTLPVPALLGGIVTDLHVKPGQVVKAGTPLVSVARSPIPRPQLTLTADILTPVSENLHEAVAKLRTAAAHHAIVSTELERVRQFTESGTSGGLPVLPRKTLIDLEYDLARAKQEKLNAERELQRHGLAPDEIDGVCKGALPPGNQRLWKRALEQNGLWGETEAAILDTLPELLRLRPWSIAAVGELSAAGLATKDLLSALRELPHMAEHFLEVASLLLDGNTVAKARILTRAGALEPIMVVKAVGDGVADWDVASVLVLPGQRVDAGDPVVLLHNPREMWLRLEPVGEELAYVSRAFANTTQLRAGPLVSGTGPDLDGLSVYRLDTQGGQEERGSVAHVICRNEFVQPDAGGPRSWLLRVGLRYLVYVPVAELEDRFVFPAGAVTDDGPEKVVFMEDGDTFLAKPVHVEYADDQVVVIANDGSIFPGDPVVMTGAFALGLALQTGTGAVDPHAGHNH